MYPHLFNQRFLNTYGICICIGLVCCFVVVRYYARVKGGVPKWVDFCEANAYVAIGVGFIAGMSGQAIFNFIKDPSQGFRITFESLTFICGLIGGVSSFIIGYLAIGRKKFGPRMVEVLPIAPVCILIAHAWGRVGCFFGGCCYGCATDSRLGLIFPKPGHKVYPTQVFEATFLFILFAALFYLAIKRNFKHGFVVYMIAYGIFRFLIEFIRGDNRGALVGEFSPSQSLSIIMVVSSIPIYFLTNYLLRKYQENTTLDPKIS